jgi:asparagine synthase (glutamine-hydrolysing)
MSGICGWLGPPEGDRGAVLDQMARQVRWPNPGAHARWSDAWSAVAAIGPKGALDVQLDGGLVVAWHGHPFLVGSGRRLAPAEFCRQVAAAYRERGGDLLQAIGGDFALAVIDPVRRTALLAVDRIGIRNLVYRVDGERLLFGPSADAVAAFPGVERRVDPQALYNYVYFHMVPGPDTAFVGYQRLLPGHSLRFEGGTHRVEAYWQIRFDEHQPARFGALAKEFRQTLIAGVETFGGADGVAAFLSGGTDSSTVSGMLGHVNGVPAKTYSIGFEAAGYDEMEYARIAARHFATEHHEYYVTPADVVAAIPIVAAAYDQPFGNASAVPTYFCAKQAAADGVARMLAGDGGDELFGGNERYARQAQLALYEHVPRVLRERLVEPALLRGHWAARLPLGRRGRSYVEQARLPMPARYESYNLLERLGPENVFDPEFLAAVDRTRPLAMLESVYGGIDAESLTNRMLGLDLKFTLADNDLPKVTRMCDTAGVDVAFPLLHESVVEFSARLDPRLKLRGTRLRYFFKEALRDFLPEEIIRKQKHGFGLPAGVWLRDYRPLNKLASDALGSLRKRRIFRSQFLEELLSKSLHEHAKYYGTMAWVLMMLELWFAEHVQRGGQVTSSAQ